ncbi:hypothetical protein Dda_5116 [Drechslerella dactyloides]|uniref:Uncharacterized protein n=1 Tax=Drechslerella dactyloides TaxID=74499 RepID=A0AAD6NIE6_DREDA|nr:hypothetical protein Dda_5116 [Drechslerella dactyloides]
MVHFSIHQLTASLSPKNVRSGLRLRKRKTSNASSTASDMICSPSVVSIASSTIYRRHSIESITSTSTAASSAILDTCNDLGLTSPYHTPAHIILKAPKKQQDAQFHPPQRIMTSSSMASSLNGGSMQIDLCGFHHSFVDAEEESFSPELAILEPRPDAHRYCGFEETLEQRPMMPFRL